MATRNYGQACSVANFLDRLGSRWTLLIVRDLLVGPRRFTELLAGLPGIGPNLLSERLQELASQRIVEKATDAPTQSTVYVLTEKGHALEPVVLSMARWGLRYLADEHGGKLRRPDLLVVAFRAVFRPEHATGVCESYEFRIDDTIFHADVENGTVDTGLGAANRPAFVFSTDAATFDAIVAGRLDAEQARKRGVLDIIGDDAAYDRCRQMFAGNGHDTRASRPHQRL